MSNTHKTALEVTHNLKREHHEKLKEIPVSEIYEEVLKLIEFNMSLDKIEEQALQIFSLKKEYHSITNEQSSFHNREIKVFSLPDTYYRTDWR